MAKYVVEWYSAKNLTQVTDGDDPAEYKLQEQYPDEGSARGFYGRLIKDKDTLEATLTRVVEGDDDEPDQVTILEKTWAG